MSKRTYAGPKKPVSVKRPVAMIVLTPDGSVIGRITNWKTRDLLSEHGRLINTIVGEDGMLAFNPNTSNADHARELAKFEHVSVTFADGERVRMLWTFEQLASIERRAYYRRVREDELFDRLGDYGTEHGD